MQNGKIIFEQYTKAESLSKAFSLASGTKSFSGVLALAAQEDGLLNLDERVSLTLPEWSRKRYAKDVTIRQLLHLESGIRTKVRRGRPPSYSQAIKIAFDNAPGERFQYGGEPFQIFGEILQRKLQAKGKSVAQ